jgi:hypothetical protein
LAMFASIEAIPDSFSARQIPEGTPSATTATSLPLDGGSRRYVIVMVPAN